MKLPNLSTKSSQEGFTLVELIIVIVVIGILAAIILVAYSGITAQANDTKYKSNAESVRKVAETINADKGYYPDAVSDFDDSDYTDLPSGLTVQANSTNAASTSLKTNAEANKVEVYFCSSGEGVHIFYPKGSTTESMTAGQC